jgi:adenylate cyclase
MPLRALAYIIPLLTLVLGVGLRLADPAFVERGRLAAFDEFLRLKPRPYTDVPVRIIDIDDATLARFGQWPWPRTLVGELIERLNELGVAAVALDILFAEPDRTSPANILPMWQKAAGRGKQLRDAMLTANLAEIADELPDHDTVLAQAMAAVPVVTGFVLTAQPTASRPLVRFGVAILGDDPKPFLPTYVGTVATLSPLELAAAGNGSLNQLPESDGVLRRVALLQAVGDKIYPSLALEALRVAQEAKTYIVKSSGASDEQAFGVKSGLSSIKIGQFVVPTDANGRIWIHFTRPAPDRTIPAWRLLEAAGGSEGDDFDPAVLNGSIVFLGASAAGLRNLKATPVDPAMAGVEIHASVAEQILLGSYINRPDWMSGAEITYLLVLGLALTLLLPRWGPTTCAAIAFVAVAAGFGTAWAAFDRLGYLVDPVYPVVVVALIYLGSSLIIYLRSEVEKRRVRGAFSRYMNPTLVDQLAASPERLKLGGEIRDMTVLFSDIRGFTTISEQFDAEQLTRFINRFLTPMTQIILERRGTIDKYMGDGIMAFWNAPLDDPDHARHAAEAALSMHAELIIFNEMLASEAARGGRPHIPIAMGIGLNSGDCCVGNMGSDQRFDYSVLGDDVNLAARLETQSKVYQVDTVIGEHMAVKIPDFATLELDMIQVKGKTHPVRVFALSGDQRVAGDPAFKRAAGLHAAMIAAYRARQWDVAADRIAELRPLMPSLAAFYDHYLDRIAEFRINPPPGDWDGTYIATSK